MILPIREKSPLSNQFVGLILFALYGIGCNFENESMRHLDREIEALISQLTIEQKVGQMTQLNLGFHNRIRWRNQDD